MHLNQGTDNDNGFFTDGDFSQDIPPSLLQAAIMNTILQELVNLVELAGLTLDTEDDTQLYQAVQAIRDSISLAFSDLSGSIADGQVPQSAVTQHEAAILLANLAGDIDDSQVPQSAVIQHETAIQIANLAGTLNSVQMPTATENARGAMEVATKAEQEAAGSFNRAVTPGRQHSHPSAAKCWVSFDDAAVIQDSYNVTSVQDIGTGHWTVVIGTDFSTVDWCALGSTVCNGVTVPEAMNTSLDAQGAGQIDVWTIDNSGTPFESALETINVAGYGDQ